MPEKWSISSSDTSTGTKTLQNSNIASLLSNDGFVCEIAMSTKATHLSSCNCNDGEVVLLSAAAILSLAVSSVSNRAEEEHSIVPQDKVLIDVN